MKIHLILLATSLLAVEAAENPKFAERSHQFSEALLNATYNKVSALFSPFSVQTLLALSQSGAKGATGDEIRRNAFLAETSEETESEMTEVLSSFPNQVSNKIYVDSAFEDNEDFVSLTRSIYNTSFENVQFANAATASSTINNWAGFQLNSQFYSGFTKGEDFNKLSKDVLVNTLSVEKGWSAPFDSSITNQDKFYLSSKTNDYTGIQMMTQGPSLYNFYESPKLDANIIEIPLGEDTSITIVLPNEIEGLSKLAGQVELALTTPAYTQQFLQLSLPKIEIDSTHYDMSAPLRDMGFQNIWSADADFSGVAAAPGDIVASSLVHSSYMYLDERGIEVEAGGAIDITFGSTKHFNVDHPFLFYIKVKGVVVLVGKIVHPTYIS